MTGGDRHDGGGIVLTGGPRNNAGPEARGTSVRRGEPAPGTPGAALAGRADEVAVHHTAGLEFLVWLEFLGEPNPVSRTPVGDGHHDGGGNHDEGC